MRLCQLFIHSIVVIAWSRTESKPKLPLCLTIYHCPAKPYHAEYFGHKLQNEKLVMFGVTHICGVDGFSGKIVGFIKLPLKNCAELYANFFRYVVYEVSIVVLSIIIGH